MPLTGFEPATIGLEVQCSILLSYRGNYEKILYTIIGCDSWLYGSDAFVNLWR